MSDPICAITELPQAWCAHCRKTPANPVAVTAEEHGPVFTAQYHGRCAVCDEHISPGQRMAWLRDGGYACEECLT